MLQQILVETEMYKLGLHPCEHPDDLQQGKLCAVSLSMFRSKYVCFSTPVPMHVCYLKGWWQ